MKIPNYVDIENIPPETLSSKTADDTGYIHEYIEACTIALKQEPKDGSSVFYRTFGILSQYPAQKIERHLGKRASEGWKLISMEPHWYYDREELPLENIVARPLAIVGWYLTFERAD